MYFSIVAATSLTKGIFILFGAPAASIAQEFIHSTSSVATSFAMKSLYFIGTPASLSKEHV